MVFRNMIVDITISSRSFVFSQFRVEVSTSLFDEGGLAVGAFDLEQSSLSPRTFSVKFQEVFRPYTHLGLWP